MSSFAIFLFVVGIHQASAALATTPTIPPSQEQSLSAVDVLKRADEATRAIHAVRYEARRFGTGQLARRYAQVEGHAVISGGFLNRSFSVARFDASIRYPRVGTVHRLTYQADGSSYCLIDHDMKKYFLNRNPRVTGLDGKLAQSLGFPEFVIPTPFTDELNGVSIKRLPEKQVEGEPCYVVDVIYAGRRQRAIWYISMRDFLPRRVDRVPSSANLDRGTVVVEISKLEVDPPIDSDTFEPEIPKDYQRSPKFAYDLPSIW